MRTLKDRRAPRHLLHPREDFLTLSQTDDMTTTTTTRPTARPTNARHLYPGRCGGFNEWVRDLAQSLMTTTPPAPEGIMSHHGLYFPWRGLTVTVAPHGPGIVISMERNLSRCDWKVAHGRNPTANLKARTWKRLRAAAALAFGKQIESEWNTGAGTSTSMTIAIPQGMAWMHNAVANYGNLPSVFDYDKATDARFKIVSDWHKALLAAHTVKQRTPVLAYWWAMAKALKETDETAKPPATHLLASVERSRQGEPLVAWWRPEGRGYTTSLAKAGHFTHGEALAIEYGSTSTVAIPLTDLGHRLELNDDGDSYAFTGRNAALLELLLANSVARRNQPKL